MWTVLLLFYVMAFMLILLLGSSSVYFKGAMKMKKQKEVKCYQTSYLRLYPGFDQRTE